MSDDVSQPVAAEPTLDSAVEDVIGDIEPTSEEDQLSLEQEAQEPSDSLEDQEQKQLVKKLKLKIDGQEVEEEIDFNDEEKLKAHLQKAKAFDKRAGEFSQLKNQVGEFVGQLKENPFMVLEQMGMDPEQLVKDYAQKIIERDAMSPEEQEKVQMQDELKRLKDERENLTKQAQEAELQKQRNEIAQTIEKDINEALTSAETVLPKNNPLVLKRVAETMLLAMQNGYPDVQAKDVIPLVEDQFKKDLASMFDVLPEDTLENVVGKHNFDRVRKKRLSSYKKKAPKKAEITDTGKSSKAEKSTKSSKSTSYSSFFSFQDE